VRLVAQHVSPRHLFGLGKIVYLVSFLFRDRAALLLKWIMGKKIHNLNPQTHNRHLFKDGCELLIQTKKRILTKMNLLYTSMIRKQRH